MSQKLGRGNKADATRQLRPSFPWRVRARESAWLRFLAIVKMVAALA